MDNQALAIPVHLLKSTIHRAVTNAIENFERDTGLTPSGIELRMTEMTAHGDKLARYGLTDVRIWFSA